MQLSDLPSRRNEAWKWTDLRAALTADAAKLAGPEGRPGAGPIEALAGLMGGQGGKVVAKAGTESTFVVRIRAEGERAILPAYAEIEIEPGASVTRIVIQESAAPSNAIVLNEVKVTLGAGSTFRQFIYAEGARLARIETSVAIMGESAVVDLNAVYLASNGRHIDLTSLVQHDAPGANTRQRVKGAAKKKSRGVFQGKFKVERSAQKTDAQMAHNALLLEEGAEVFAKPELEIYADDVACAHGNTAGQLDEGAVFYIRSRGIPEVEARAMLTRAFLIEALPDWLDDALRIEAEGKIDSWLGGAGG